MEDFPWFWVAMIFIAFIGWLRNRIREVGAARREKRAAKADARRGGSSPPPPTARRQQQPPQTAERPPPSSPSPSGAPASLEDLMRQLTGAIEPEKETRSTSPTRTKSSPPPLPPGEPQVEEIPFPVSVKPREVAPPIHAGVSSRRRRGDQRDRLMKLLGNREDLQSAILLREILDRPLALRDEAR
ncbi:MAG: hypothetical protein AAF236_11930 [Verrucomicrobiota bacterium]